MNPLKTLETMLSNLVEGTFGRLFRSEVRPMELARRLTREMDAHRTQSVSRVYAPNEYAVWLSPEDRALYEGVEVELIEELCAYLLEHARSENLMLASPPQIVFHTDAQLTLGEFGIEARLVRPEEQLRPDEQGQPAPALVSASAEDESSVSQEWLDVPKPAAPDPSAGPARRGADARRGAVPSQFNPPASDPSAGGARPGAASAQSDLPPSPAGRGAVPHQSQSTERRGAVPPQSPERRGAVSSRSSRAMLLTGGRRVLVPPSGAVLGRSRECDIVLDDAGVSRRHAQISPTEDGWTLVDLGSTNGVRINDRALRGKHELRLGDRIELGATELVFEVR